jgi:prophage regulatory protein
MKSVLRLPAVRARTGRSRSSIYADIKLGRFPAPIKLGPRSVGWLETDVMSWLESRIAASRGRQQ